MYNKNIMLKNRKLVFVLSPIALSPFLFAISCSNSKKSNEDNEQTSYSFEIESPSVKIYVNKPYDFSVKSLPKNNSVSNFYYKWDVNENYEIVTNNEKATITFKKQGIQKVNVKIYSDSSMTKLLDEISTNVNVEQEDSIIINLLPTDEQLLIEGKPLKYTSWIPLKKPSTFLVEETNKYGVVNTFSLITKIYANSNIMNQNDFDNLNVLLVNNNNYDYLKFEVNAIANKSLSGFGRFPFPSLIEGWKGTDINSSDKVKIIFEYQRNTSSSAKGKNTFDSNKVFFGNTLSSSSTIGWNKLGVDIDLPFMTDFEAKCSIYVNDNLIKTSSSWDNRTHFAIIYNYQNEYDSYNKDVNVLCDNKSKQ